MYHHNKIIGKANKERIEAYKMEKGCKDCGNKHPAVLQFHHRDQKDKPKRRLSSRLTYAWETILKELELCDVLCANCHLIRHYSEKSGYFAQKEQYHDK